MQVDTSVPNLPSTFSKKRKWDDLATALKEKHEMEKHALILASMSGLGIPENHHDSTSISSSSTSKILLPEQQSDSQTLIDEVSLEEDPTTSSSSAEDSPTSIKEDDAKHDTKKRIRTTPDQLRLLEKTYEQEKIPSQSLREELAQKLGMTPRRVQVWFQNKRAKERRLRKTLKPPYIGLPPEYHHHHHHYVPAGAPPLGFASNNSNNNSNNNNNNNNNAVTAASYVPVHTYPRQDAFSLVYPTAAYPWFELPTIYSAGKSAVAASSSTLCPAAIFHHVVEEKNNSKAGEWKNQLPPLRCVFDQE